eukprot:1161251-Pelagomonas_calceolata.AAC.11
MARIQGMARVNLCARCTGYPELLPQDVWAHFLIALAVMKCGSLNVCAHTFRPVELWLTHARDQSRGRHHSQLPRSEGLMPDSGHAEDPSAIGACNRQWHCAHYQLVWHAPGWPRHQKKGQLQRELPEAPNSSCMPSVALEFESHKSGAHAKFAAKSRPEPFQITFLRTHLKPFLPPQIDCEKHVSCDLVNEFGKHLKREVRKTLYVCLAAGRAAAARPAHSSSSSQLEIELREGRVIAALPAAKHAYSVPQPARSSICSYSLLSYSKLAAVAAKLAAYISPPLRSEVEKGGGGQALHVRFAHQSHVRQVGHQDREQQLLKVQQARQPLWVRETQHVLCHVCSPMSSTTSAVLSCLDLAVQTALVRHARNCILVDHTSQLSASAAAAAAAVALPAYPRVGYQHGASWAATKQANRQNASAPAEPDASTLPSPQLLLVAGLAEKFDSSEGWQLELPTA